MGELSTVDLRNMATTHPHGPSGPEIRQALQWAADRIDYLEGYIEVYERERSEQRHKALDELTAEAQAMGFYDGPKPGGSKETNRD